MNTRLNARMHPYVLAATVLLAAGLMSCTPVGGSNPDPNLNASPGTGSSAMPAIAGDWTGTWIDTRYDASGSLAATFVVSGSTVTATGSIDLSQIGLGLETGTASGSLSGDTLAFSFNADTVGNGTGTLKNASASGTGTVTGSLNFGAFTFTGTASDSAIDGTFQFTSASGGNGTVSMTKK